MQDFRSHYLKPQVLQTAEGSERRVGVELEFAGVSARTSAELVRSLFGGTIVEKDPHRFVVKDTRFGDFVCELDSQYVHDAEGDETAIDATDLKVRFRRSLQEIVGDVSALLVPAEVVCPPIACSDLPELAALVTALEEAGACGTRDNMLYAFGAQLNPEIATSSPAYIASVMKAYLLLSPWLRKIIDVDPTRKLTFFADPFPAAYQRKILSPDYWPEMDRLIDDYLADNPTRNRELDMLPLFSHLDDARVQKAIRDPLIKSRPTFHYRLPDARLGDADWSLALEWNRWLAVERLAGDGEKLKAMSVEFLRFDGAGKPKAWAWRASEWLALA